jgi:hypothetical protein
MTALWVVVGILATLLIALGAGAFLLMAMGRLHLDLGWGRSLHELGPIEIRIAAPRELVFEIISAPYLGRAPAGSNIEVLARGSDLVVAAHHTPVHFYTSRTVEAVDFDRPSRVGFRHLTGPVPHAVEEFTLTEVEGSASTSSSSAGSRPATGSYRSGKASFVSTSMKSRSKPSCAPRTSARVGRTERPPSRV